MSKNKIFDQTVPAPAFLPKGSKVFSEIATRARVLNSAKQLGIEEDVLAIFRETDSLLRGCTDPSERQAIATFGAMKIHKLLGADGSLEIDGKKVY